MYDAEIRPELISYIWSRNPKLSGLIEELPVNNGRAIADLVALHEQPHCYEIKGSHDKVSRALAQGVLYATSFNKMTLVTSYKQALIAKTLLPTYWGILAVFKKPTGFEFKFIRGAKNNKDLDKALALQILWREEMLKVADSFEVKISPKSANKKVISQILATNLTKSEINKSISKALLSRQKALLRNKCDVTINSCF